MLPPEALLRESPPSALCEDPRSVPRETSALSLSQTRGSSQLTVGSG
jgi:hypothetical protein